MSFNRKSTEDSRNRTFIGKLEGINGKQQLLLLFYSIFLESEDNEFHSNEIQVPDSNSKEQSPPKGI